MKKCRCGFSMPNMVRLLTTSNPEKKGPSQSLTLSTTKRNYRDAIRTHVLDKLTKYSSFCFVLPSLLKVVYPNVHHLLNLLYFNNNSLSYLLLEIFYLIGNRRIFLINSINKMFSDPT